MLEKLRIVFSIPELRQKILLTLLLLAIYRIGWQISLPVINQVAARGAADTEASGGFGSMIQYAAVFSASNLSQATVFGLGIMPYISASIIFQLLGSVWKPIEELQKEGESGRKKINEYTRYVTVILCLIQSWFYVKLYVMGTDSAGVATLVHPAFLSSATNNLHFGWQICCVLTMTCGTIFLMWLGEQIDEYGIGNGISLLIMAGILAQMPGGRGQSLAKLGAEADRFGQWRDRRGSPRCAGLLVRGRGCWRCIHHTRTAENPDAKCQTCAWSPRLWRDPPILAAEN